MSYVARVPGVHCTGLIITFGTSHITFAGRKAQRMAAEGRDNLWV